ncbi:MAG TPA: hypothetical protein VN939_10350 [Chthoniobacterales bacterium]|nr:hypothetical protein [Chthoniobacterales bacterium]
MDTKKRESEPQINADEERGIGATDVAKDMSVKKDRKKRQMPNLFCHVSAKATSCLPNYKSHFSVALALRLIFAQRPRAKALGYLVLPFNGRFTLLRSS